MTELEPVIERAWEERDSIGPSTKGEVRLAAPLQVRFRRGGESLRLSSGGRTRELRDLFQEAGVPPRLATATSQAEDWIADLVRDGALDGSDRNFAWRAMADAIASLKPA